MSDFGYKVKKNQSLSESFIYKTNKKNKIIIFTNKR